MGKDQSTTHKHSSNFAVVLFAAAAGAIAGLLFAPKQGAETREDLRAKYNGAVNKSQDAAETARDKATQGYESIRSKVQSTADKSKDVVDNAADKAAEKVKNATGKVSDGTKQATDRRDERSGHDHASM